MSKRTLDGFFTPQNKKPKTLDTVPVSPPSVSRSSHPAYPFSIPHLPPDVSAELELLVTAEGKTVNDQPHLDLLYFQPFIPRPTSSEYFKFLRAQLPFYRVVYSITRFGKETVINTPRYTTVFGVDDTSTFTAANTLISAASTSNTANPNSQPIPPSKYKCTPRPIPQCLDLLRHVTSAATNTTYNFCLVNYYATGTDSITYHSDDERFLGPDPAIASFSLGAPRDFLMKHKPAPNPSDGLPNQAPGDTKPMKMPLSSGDMILMRGPTQANWLHSIPKRTANGGGTEGGRINITFRRARVVGGTENYYKYNVGDGPVYRWDEKRREMALWSAAAAASQ